MTALYLLGCALASYGCIRFLSWLCKPVSYRQIGRFAGNEQATALYEHRRDAFGHSTVRNVRVKEIA